MKRNNLLFQLSGFAFTSFFGTILHFLYEWSEENILFAPFSGVNESTWEHMKLIFWPMLIFAVFQSLFFRERKNYWRIKLKGIVTGLIMIPVIFYTYNGVIGSSPDFINIAIFFVSAAVAYIYEYRLLKKEASGCIFSEALSLSVIIVIAVLFVVFTFITPQIGIFKDPLTGNYGV